MCRDAGRQTIAFESLLQKSCCREKTARRHHLLSPRCNSENETSVKMVHPTPFVGHRQTNNGERIWKQVSVKSQRIFKCRLALVGAYVVSGLLLEALEKGNRAASCFCALVCSMKEGAEASNAVDHITPSAWCLLLHKLKAVHGFDCDNAKSVRRQSGACTVPVHRVHKA